jgi:carbonic anhydrase/acetyltransferase-like protein (isoleucine patch superfamily)
MGSPAKVVRQLKKKEIKELYASASRYVSFKNEYT